MRADRRTDGRLPGLIEFQQKVRSIGKREAIRRLRLARARARADLARGAAWPALERYFLIVGHPRSGSTLLAALLDAHEQIGVAHEGEILRVAVDGGSRRSLLARTGHHCVEFRRLGFEWEGYSYRIGDDQGRPAGCRVLGDKSAGRAADLLVDRPDAVEVLESIIGLPVHVVVLERNPMDVVATMLRKGGAHLHERDVIDRHRRRVEAVTALRARRPLATQVIHHVELCADPARALTEVLGALRVPPSAEYLEAAVRAVDPTPSRTSLARDWDRETLDAAARLCSSTERLHRYLGELDELADARR